jgi:hypothetical protein
MKRFFVLLVAVMGLALPGSTAWARGDGWQPPTPIDPFDLDICGATLHFEVPVNREWSRVITFHGQLVVQITGSLVVNITNPATEQSVSNLNISGPGFLPITEEGFEFSSRGRNLNFLSTEQAQENDLPELLLTTGFIDIVFNDDGTLTVKKLEGNVIDLCLDLT